MDAPALIGIVSICVTILLALGGVIFHAGVMHNKMTQLRTDHEEEKAKNRKMRHDDMDRLSQEIARLQLLVLKLIPREEWPDNL